VVISLSLHFTLLHLLLLISRLVQCECQCRSFVTPLAAAVPAGSLGVLLLLQLVLIWWLRRLRRLRLLRLRRLLSPPAAFSTARDISAAACLLQLSLVFANIDIAESPCEPPQE